LAYEGEVALYAKAFQRLAAAAIYGREARELVAAALLRLRGE
jgi:hypothetical protein